ncbi:MAG: hypothetical protein V1866_03675 [archaeon]
MRAYSCSGGSCTYSWGATAEDCDDDYDGWYNGGDSGPGCTTMNDPQANYRSYYCIPDGGGPCGYDITDTTECDGSDGYYGGGNTVTATCGSTDNDATSTQRDYYATGASCTYTTTNCATADADASDGWYGGGNTAGCNEDATSIWRDYYITANSATTTYTTTCTGTGTLDPETTCGADICGNACNGTMAYSYLDYFFASNSIGCSSAVGTTLDNCTNKTLLQCPVQTTFRNYTALCSAGACTYSDSERDSASLYCTYGSGGNCTAMSWMSNVPTSGSQCCGDDNTSDSSYYYNATPTSAGSILCERCDAGVYSAPAVYYGNGYIIGSTCYYSDIACSAASGGNASTCTIDANDICADGTDCIDCTVSGYLRQNTTACYTSCTTNEQCAPSYSCRANSQCENDVLMYTKFMYGQFTTDLSSISSANSNVNLTLQLNSNTTLVKWRNTVSINSSWNMDLAVDLNSTFAYVNSSRYPALNGPANISVFGMLGFKSTPVILRDGLPCTDCHIIYWDMTAGNFTFNVTGFSNYTWVENSLSCYFLNETSCPANHVKLIGVKNDTGGYENAHAQNYTINNYNYSLCCNSTNTSVLLGSGCNQEIVIKLALENNSHVELGNETNYSIIACMNSSWGSISCEYPTGLCNSNQTCVMSIASSEGDNTTNAHLGSCNTYNQKVCCGIIQLPNYAPSKPTIYYPDNNNMSVSERKPNFNWSVSSDPNNDPVNYTLNITCGPSCPASCEFGSLSGLNTTNYTLSSALCVDRVYNWTVSACDYELCNASDQFNFTIESILSLVLIVNKTEFGTVSIGSNVNTDGLSPFPLVGRNDGNVLINTTINATALFSSVGMNDYYYMFRSADNESGSIVESCSQTAYTGMDNATQKDLFCNLSYDDSNDEARIHLNITVPLDEPSGYKQSYIDVNPSCADC